MKPIDPAKAAEARRCLVQLQARLDQSAEELRDKTNSIKCLARHGVKETQRLIGRDQTRLLIRLLANQTWVQHEVDELQRQLDESAGVNQPGTH